MKTLKLSTLAACLFVLVFSCTKDSTSDSTSLAVSRSVVLSKEASVKSAASAKKPVLSPAMYLTADPEKNVIPSAEVRQSITITFAATDAETKGTVNCGNIVIYKFNATTGVWEQVATANAPTVSYTFTPATADDCAYKFRAGFSPGATDDANQCKGTYSGVDYLEQQDYCPDITSDCVDFFTVESDVSARKLTDGNYEFTVSYTLSSPKAIDNIKFQGGATSGGQFQHNVTSMENLVYVNENKQNNVMKYEGPLAACTPLTVSFTYVRRFSCPETAAEVTGKWTATADGMEPYIVDPLTYSCDKDGNKL
jgi:hypothetical protein